MDKLLRINSCLYCKYCKQEKDYKLDIYIGECRYEKYHVRWDSPNLIEELEKIHTKTIWETGATQCIVSFIPDWCPLPNAEDKEHQNETSN